LISSASSRSGMLSISSHVSMRLFMNLFLKLSFLELLFFLFCLD
jgi:hypothetical protein